MSRFLEFAKQQATEHKYDDSMEYRLCAVIVSGGRILSVGYNKRNLNGFVRHYQSNVREFCCATHAEQDAVLSIRKKIDLTGSKMFVVRLNANGGYAMSRSCSMCVKVLRGYGIQKSYYSINNDQFGLLKLSKNNQEEDRVFQF